MSTYLPTRELRPRQPLSTYYPRNTIRCMGSPFFRSQHARDVASLVDLDDNVVSWSCRVPGLVINKQVYWPDFVAEHPIGRTLVMAATSDYRIREPLLLAEAQRLGYDLLVQRPEDLPVLRLQNAKDLLSCATARVTLDERLRLLCLLDECGSASVAECLQALRAPSPMAALGSLYLKRLIHMDIDEALIGPDTIVRRNRA